MLSNNYYSKFLFNPNVNSVDPSRSSQPLKKTANYSSIKTTGFQSKINSYWFSINVNFNKMKGLCSLKHLFQNIANQELK